MSKKPKLVICRNCNTPIAKSAKICPSCGARNKKPFYKKWWFILFIIIIAVGAVGSIRRNKTEKFNWSEIELSAHLPEPKSNAGNVVRNDGDGLSMQVEKVSKTDYRAYLEACESMGYTVDTERNGDNYSAFDENGYGLSLSYIGETMNIMLEAPMEMGSLSWPKSEIAGLLPLPESDVGKVSSDSSDGCYIYIGETSIDDFNTYADTCSEQGFSVDYERGDKFYNAEDGNGNRLSLSYCGNNIMTVEIRKSDNEEGNRIENAAEQENSSKTEAAEDIAEASSVGTESDGTEPSEMESAETQLSENEKPGDSTELVDGMHPEFKEAMDNYEEFMNEYCDFMQKYAESDGTDLGLLKDYAAYMSRYTDVVESFEAWDGEEMNTAETAYYIDVQARVSKKLLEVAE